MIRKKWWEEVGKGQERKRGGKK
jgi:hypothetical protein